MIDLANWSSSINLLRAMCMTALGWTGCRRVDVQRPCSKRTLPCACVRPICSTTCFRVVYSHAKKDVPVDSLAQLLEAEYCGTAAWSGKDKLARAVGKSAAVVAAFARSGDLPIAAAAGAAEEETAASKLCLVGFARASSDLAFTATIHNVIVHPAARRRGIGRNLLARLTAQMKRGGVTDIGLLAPDDTWDFFQKACFDSDRELSVPMRLTRSETEPFVF